MIRSCVVAWDDRGTRREIEVDADSAYEAIIFAAKQVRETRDMLEPQPQTIVEVIVERPTTVKIKMQTVINWLYAYPSLDKTPEQRARRRRLRELFAHHGRH